MTNPFPIDLVVRTTLADSYDNVTQSTDPLSMGEMDSNFIELKLGLDYLKDNLVYKSSSAPPAELETTETVWYKIDTQQFFVFHVASGAWVEVSQ